MKKLKKYKWKMIYSEERERRKRNVERKDNEEMPQKRGRKREAKTNMARLKNKISRQACGESEVKTWHSVAII